MTYNGLSLLLTTIAVVACIGWIGAHRRSAAAERRANLHARIATEKGQRLLVALNERDEARAHADDAQWVLNAIVNDERDEAKRRHPSNVRVLKSVQ